MTLESVETSSKSFIIIINFILKSITYFRCCFQFVLSLSLAILALYSVSASDVLVLVPPTLPFFLTFSACVCFFFMSSTWRGLAVIVFALESFAPILEGSLVKWFTVSQTAARIIEVGSMKLDLHRLAIKIFQFCAEHSIYLEVQWIPRTENEGADYISRLVDFDDWQITPDLFQSLEQLWSPHTVDCFANYYTAKLPRFFSRFWNPGTSRIDFFAQELSSENCLVVPPVALVARVIHYLSLQKAMATVVVPLWPSSSFWPLLTSKYRSLIKGCFTRSLVLLVLLARLWRLDSNFCKDLTLVINCMDNCVQGMTLVM